MNYLLFVAALVATFATLGHFLIGYKLYMTPVVESELQLQVKRTVLSLFHYMSVFMTITAVLLWFLAFELPFDGAVNRVLALFIGLVYFGFAVVNFILAIKPGIFKLFQWIFWLLIAIFSVVGSSSY